jgi:hypothetical protein
LIRTRPWSAIVRVPTAGGHVWFKENAPSSAFEPALTVLVARRRPDYAPEVIDAEGARMLTRNVGPQLRELLNAGAAAPAWESILPLYAELQVELVPDVDEALAARTPNLRPERLPELYDDLIGRLGFGELQPLSPAVREAAEALSDAIPVTIAHLEATEGNIFIGGGRPIFIDWAEACVSHPFVGCVLSLRNATERGGHAPGSADVERLRDVYLEPFTRFAPIAKMRKVFAHGYLLGAVCKALSWDECLAPLAPSVREELNDPIAGWLEILGEVASGTTTLGGA